MNAGDKHGEQPENSGLWRLSNLDGAPLDFGAIEGKHDFVGASGPELFRVSIEPERQPDIIAGVIARRAGSERIE